MRAERDRAAPSQRRILDVLSAPLTSLSSHVHLSCDGIDGWFGSTQVKGRIWTALRKAVEAEMAKPGSGDWSSVCNHTHGLTMFKLGPSRSMDDFPLEEPK
jgi:hypothetical protein